MRAARTIVNAIAVAAAMAGIGVSPATADTIVVTPGTPHPGQRIHLTVPGCSVGPTPHIAESGAFTRAVTLYGKADTGEADPRIRKGLRPGAYPITASCGAGHILQGQVIVAGEGVNGPVGRGTPSPPTESPLASISASPAASHGNGGSSTPYWVLGAAVVLLAGGAGAFAARHRSGSRR